jgi:CDP-6-deoxy-D-xylo-4-hexulose-3-dehydrase
MQAALGLSQLSKLEMFVQARRSNYEYLNERLSGIEGLQIAKATENSEPSWFGFPITLDVNHPVNREDLIKFLNSRKIATRLVFAGNITKQPAYKDVNFRIVGDLKNSDIAMTRSFWLGVYPGLTNRMLDYVAESVIEFMDRH